VTHITQLNKELYAQTVTQDTHLTMKSVYPTQQLVVMGSLKALKLVMMEVITMLDAIQVV
jgi:hypothetical protein